MSELEELAAEVQQKQLKTTEAISKDGESVFGLGGHRFIDTRALPQFMLWALFCEPRMNEGVAGLLAIMLRLGGFQCS